LWKGRRRRTQKMGYNFRLVLCALFVCVLSYTSKATTEGEVDPPKLIVDLSANTMQVYKEGKIIHTFYNIQHGRRVSSVPRSRGTPVIECMARKEPKHRFGPVFRLCYGIDGDRQGRRGILIHKDMSSRSSYTSGCIALRNLTEMRKLYSLTPDLVLLEIKK